MHGLRMPASNELLAVLREDPRRFAAVINDEVMPRLCGTRPTEALRASAPDLPVLLAAGAAARFWRLVPLPLA